MPPAYVKCVVVTIANCCCCCSSLALASPHRTAAGHLSHLQPVLQVRVFAQPRRVLTKPSKGVKNDGYDNEDSDYILYVNDILGSEEAGHKYALLGIATCCRAIADNTPVCQKPLPHPRRPRPGHLRTGGQVPESKDAGGRCRQGHQEPDRLLQPEHDGGVRPRSGERASHPPLPLPVPDPSAVACDEHV